ncbi:flavoprotein [Streptomyces sp. NPDC049577]|uniref:flavoprotein n=1 Tax=Streptomyces sp. NPDC049577 TaxID=3155153 RepID=UPI00341BA207
MTANRDHRVLYLVCCAAPPALRITTGIHAAQAAGWDVCLILTPYAHRWLEDDVTTLHELTGHPVRHQYKLPQEPDVLPPPDAVLVAPATFNTLNKWAAGTADTLALGLITEAIGLGLPIVALPHINAAQAAHPALDRSVATLRGAGVTVLLGEGGHDPHAPQQGTFPWQEAIGALA